MKFLPYFHLSMRQPENNKGQVWDKRMGQWTNAKLRLALCLRQKSYPKAVLIVPGTGKCLFQKTELKCEDEQRFRKKGETMALTTFWNYHDHYWVRILSLHLEIVFIGIVRFSLPFKKLYSWDWRDSHASYMADPAWFYPQYCVLSSEHFQDTALSTTRFVSKGLIFGL